MLLILINSDVIDDGNSYESTAITFFTIRIYLSLLTSSFGVAKFLQLGPCQLIPQNKMGIGMLMITVANFVGLLCKVFFITGILSTYVYVKNSPIGPSHLFFEVYWRAFCIGMLPGFILVTFKKHYFSLV